MHAHLRCVSREQEILAIRVGDDDLLIAQRHGIQPAVGVLLQKIEIGDVVLPAIRIEIAEDTQARLLFDEQKTAKIAIESLNARTYRDEIEIRPDVVQFDFAECFLQAEVRIQARGAFAHVHVDDARVPARPDNSN